MNPINTLYLSTNNKLIFFFIQFEQNPKLLEELMATGNTTLVEASPLDKIWGIGLAEDDPRAHNKSQWLGKNWLGYALTDVREAIKKEQEQERK